MGELQAQPFRNRGGLVILQMSVLHRVTMAALAAAQRLTMVAAAVAERQLLVRQEQGLQAETAATEPRLH